MDDFKYNKPKKTRHFVDGMQTPIRPKPVFSSTFNKAQPASNLPVVRNSLSTFRASDGFRPSDQTINNNSQLGKVGRQPRRGPDGNIDLTLPPAPDKPHKKRSRKKIALRSLAGVTAVVLLVGGLMFGKGYLKIRGVLKGGAEGAAALQDNVDPSKLRGEGDGRVNILLLGRGGEGHDGPDLTDTILVASIDPIQKKAALLSIPRDLWAVSYTHLTLPTKRIV